MPALLHNDLPSTNPVAIMRMLQSPHSRTDLNQLKTERERRIQLYDAPDGRHGLGTLPDSECVDADEPIHQLRLHQGDESTADSIDAQSTGRPPARQVQQLVEHLRGEQKKLAQREADLQAQTYHWEKQVMAGQADLNRRADELHQHETQVRLHQKQLSQLQQKLVDGKDAIYRAVEQVIDNCPNAELESRLETLNHELKNRLDDFAARWERLISK